MEERRGAEKLEDNMLVDVAGGLDGAGYPAEWVEDGKCAKGHTRYKVTEYSQIGPIVQESVHYECKICGYLGYRP